jgi:hypothetical protein
VVHAGDALADSASVGPEGAAGIIVDLFAEGQLIPQLTQVGAAHQSNAAVMYRFKGSR